MSTVLVTGATGFIGGHVTQALLDRGHQVRALVRPGSGLRWEHPSLSVAAGDVRNPASLAAAVEGCDSVVHLAALYTFWAPERLMRQVNVEGTRNVLQAAANAGVKRIVHTSTVSTVRLHRDGTRGDETQDARPQDLVGPYKRTKFEAEQVAQQFAWRGTPVVIVNPTAPVGPGDRRPTPTGKVVLDFLRRALPAYVNTGLNLVDIADVAEGHVLALEKGQVGERYLLGSQEGNLTLAQVLQALEQLTGLPAPQRRVPWALAMAAAYVDRLVEGTLLRRQPRIPLEGTRMARKYMWVDCSKAVRELRLPQHSVQDALRRAVDWYVAEGYAHMPASRPIKPSPKRLPKRLSQDKP